MSNYRPIYGKLLWNNKNFIELNSDEKVVFLYLLTNPNVEITGIYSLKPEIVAIECGVDISEIYSIIESLQIRDLIVYLPEDNLFYIFNYFYLCKGMIKNPTTLYKCIIRQRELIRNQDVWDMFDSEYKDIIQLIQQSINKLSNK